MALGEGVGTTIGALDGIADGVGQGGLDQLAREVSEVSRPVAERGAEAVDGAILHIHAAQQHQHGHLRERTTTILTREDPAVLCFAEQRAHFRQHGQGGGGERHTMFDAGLHALGGDDPDSGVPVDLRPARAEAFPRARGSEDRELQGTGGDGRTAAQRRHERRQLLHGHRRVMAAHEALILGQQHVQVPTPAGGIVPLTQALGPRGVQHPLNATAQAGARHGCAFPDRTQHRQHVVRRDLIDGKRLQRLRCDGERGAPLRMVLGIGQRHFQAGQHVVGDLTEGDDRVHGLASGDGVDAGRHHAPRVERRIARGGEGDELGAAKAHFPALTAPLENEHPAFGEAGIDMEIEAAAIGMAARFFNGGDGARGESIGQSGHPVFLLSVEPFPS